MQNVTQKSGNENRPKYPKNLSINWNSFIQGCLNVNRADASCQYEVWQHVEPSEYWIPSFLWPSEFFPLLAVIFNPDLTPHHMWNDGIKKIIVGIYDKVHAKLKVFGMCNLGQFAGFSGKKIRQTG